MIFSHMTRDVTVFVKCDTIFRLFSFFVFFWKLQQVRTSNFRKVVWQHTEGTGMFTMVASITWVLLEIYFCIQRLKNFQNPLRIDKVIATSLV